ncbi:hypothetical protein SCHPADRAFT_744067 [Schizopora paradoxa]|uniref:Uncharacterized protein n=1 Tax=Schizopora paradoxa TaxID=27342 RepID=A0A0H2QZ37_9AGAM|nr:hypothetical protein SCHPADRAFT_744067 [Schizopora paradoxa]
MQTMQTHHAQPGYQQQHYVPSHVSPGPPPLIPFALSFLELVASCGVRFFDRPLHIPETVLLFSTYSNSMVAYAQKRVSASKVNEVTDSFGGLQESLEQRFPLYSSKKQLSTVNSPKSRPPPTSPHDAASADLLALSSPRWHPLPSTSTHNSNRRSVNVPYFVELRLAESFPYIPSTRSCATIPNQSHKFDVLTNRLRASAAFDIYRKRLALTGARQELSICILDTFDIYRQHLSTIDGPDCVLSMLSLYTVTVFRGLPTAGSH